MSIRFGFDVGAQFYGQVDKAIETVIMVEKWGFQAAAFPDHLFHPKSSGYQAPWEIFTTLGAVAARTNQIRLISSVTDPVRRHPAIIAQAIGTLDHISKGRVMLGIGAGETFNIEPLLNMNWHKPFTRLREAIALIKELWISEKNVTSTGEYFRVNDAAPIFKPIQKPHPPIYVAAMGPRTRRLVGQIADGWWPIGYSPEIYRRHLKDIERAAKEAGRSVDEVDAALVARCYVSKDGEDARKMAIQQSRITFCTSPHLLKDLGHPALAEKAIPIWKMSYSKEDLNRISKLAEEVPLDVVEKNPTFVAGTPDEAIGQVEKFIQAGVKFFLVLPPYQKDRFLETLKAFRDKIIPYFAE